MVRKCGVVQLDRTTVKKEQRDSAAAKRVSKP